MTSRTGRTAPPAADRHPRPAAGPGFTLIELILVMALLVVGFSLSMPTLQRFFRGRALDSEAHRLLALTRYGQSRATSEAVPMVVWIDPRLGTYGLRPDPAFPMDDPRSLEFSVPSELMVDLPGTTNATAATRLPGDPQPNPIATSTPQEWLRNDPLQNRAITRPLPDGYVSLTSPRAIRLRRETEDPLWLVLNTNRLAYEIRNDRELGRLNPNLAF